MEVLYISKYESYKHLLPSNFIGFDSYTYVDEAKGFDVTLEVLALDPRENLRYFLDSYGQETLHAVDSDCTVI